MNEKIETMYVELFDEKEILDRITKPFVDFQLISPLGIVIYSIENMEGEKNFCNEFYSLYREMYQNKWITFRGFIPIGVWADEAIEVPIVEKEGEKYIPKYIRIKAASPKGREKINKIFREYLARAEDKLTISWIHLHTFYLSKDMVDYLFKDEGKKFKEKIIYTAHSIYPYHFLSLEIGEKLAKEIAGKITLENLNKKAKEIKKKWLESGRDRISDLLYIYPNLYYDSSIKEKEIFDQLYKIAVQKFLIKEAKTVIFASEDIKNKAKEYYKSGSRKNIYVIESGTPICEYFKKKDEKYIKNIIKFRKEISNNAQILLGCFGKATEEDCLLNLIDTFYEVKRKIKNTLGVDVALLIVNTSKEKKFNLIGNLKMENIIVFDDPSIVDISKLLSLYLACDAIIYPAEREPQGIIPLGAILLGKEVMVRDVDNLSTLVKEGLAVGFKNKLEEEKQMIELVKKIIKKRNELSFNEELKLIRRGIDEARNDKESDKELQFEIQNRLEEFRKNLKKLEKYSIISSLESYHNIYSSYGPLKPYIELGEKLAKLADKTKEYKKKKEEEINKIETTPKKVNEYFTKQKNQLDNIIRRCDIILTRVKDILNSIEEKEDVVNLYEEEINNKYTSEREKIEKIIEELSKSSEKINMEEIKKYASDVANSVTEIFENIIAVAFPVVNRVKEKVVSKKYTESQKKLKELKEVIAEIAKLLKIA